jgi:hypothetical protein
MDAELWLHDRVRQHVQQNVACSFDIHEYQTQQEGVCTRSWTMLITCVQAIKDYQLLLIVAVLLFVDTIVLMVWAASAPMSLKLVPMNDKAVEHGTIRIVPELEQCYSEHSFVFQIVLYAYKGLLMVSARELPSPVHASDRHSACSLLGRRGM